MKKLMLDVFLKQRRFGQKLMDGNESNQKLLDYLIWLQTPNESFGGVPIVLHQRRF